jgi:hypothetical protein
MSKFPWRYLFPMLRQSLRLVRQKGRKLTEEDLLELTCQVVGADAPGFYHLAGFITITWGGIELYVDLTIILAITFKKTKATQLPRALEAKIATFKQIFDENDSLAQFRGRANYIADEMTRLKTVRHDIVHGKVFETLPDGTRRIIRLLGVDQSAHIKSDYKIQDIFKALQEMGTLNETLQSFFNDFLALLRVEIPDKANR